MSVMHGPTTERGAGEDRHDGENSEPVDRNLVSLAIATITNVPAADLNCR